jgi:hypothetical protein
MPAYGSWDTAQIPATAGSAWDKPQQLRQRALSLLCLHRQHHPGGGGGGGGSRRRRPCFSCHASGMYLVALDWNSGQWGGEIS